MVLTVILFYAFYSNFEILQRKNDVNRIKNINSAMELEDADFIKMVDELRIDYDVHDLKEITFDFESKMQKIW